ncbi:MAG: tRNA (N6-threonylcarbamoyladenosine(37)-N6)-methyltransferase TrmO [Oscillospiraceae bacterium]|nr:tRNA (N6-threonylcarbamoyladenosine(37)-N6)-methyltransferase TrmO [Oscillospiraceae bacterium]
MEMRPIAHIHNDYTAKFGIPRQSGLVEEVVSTIVFEPQYRNLEAFRGIEGYSHLWLLWIFSEAVRDTWSPTVLPPRLGGKTRMGVFATRSPFRPNPIGLSSVKLVGFEQTKDGPVLHVAGADLMDGTPILDVKPYLPYTDSHPDAVGGFADPVRDYHLQVVFPEDLMAQVPKRLREPVLGLLAQDPRPSYQNDPERLYGVAFGNYDFRFHVKDGILTVCEVEKLK